MQLINTTVLLFFANLPQCETKVLYGLHFYLHQNFLNRLSYLINLKRFVYFIIDFSTSYRIGGFVLDTDLPMNNAMHK